MYKLANRFYTGMIWTVIFFAIVPSVAAQDSTFNKYGLWVIGNVAAYQKSTAGKPELALVDLKKLIPGIAFDLKYAGTNNFTHRQLYPALTTTYLRRNAAVALAAVQKELNKKGLCLKVFDAYRPYAATELMWELVKDERYAADPKKGSGHNRGVAIDLTIIDLKTKAELNMGTGFDNFTDTAHHDFKNLSPQILQNRLLLRKLMEANGFKVLETEWWHYTLPDAKQYPLLNISFDELKKICR